MCIRWAESFLNFLLDMGYKPTPEHSIERLDNESGYSPDNCVWATKAEQLRNTRRTIRVNGMCLKDVCAARNIPYSRALYRIHNGASVEDALSQAPWKKEIVT